jgi:hypothetical protein
MKTIISNSTKDGANATAFMRLYCHNPQVIDFASLRREIEALVKVEMKPVSKNAKQKRRAV